MLSVLIHSVGYESVLAFHSTNQSLSRHSIHSQDGGDCLHVLAVGHAGLAVVPVHEDRLHALAEDQAALGGVGGGMLASE